MRMRQAQTSDTGMLNDASQTQPYLHRLQLLISLEEGPLLNSVEQFGLASASSRCADVLGVVRLRILNSPLERHRRRNGNTRRNREVTGTENTRRSEEDLNNLRAFLLGGDGAPVYAPDGLLEFSGLSPEQLARACGITRTAIYFYIERKCRPTTRILRQIAAAVGVRFDQVLEYCTPAPVGRPPKTDLRLTRPSHSEGAAADATRKYGRGIRRDKYDIKSDAQRERQKFQQEVRLRTAKLPNFSERGAEQHGFRMEEDSNLSADGSTRGTFALELKRLMSEHDPPLDIKKLADSMSLSYEHVRKIVRGLSVPTRFIILALAAYFDVDSAELEAIAKADLFKRKYGEEFEIPASSPGLREIVSEWGKLTGVQKEALLTMLEAFIAQNGSQIR